MSHKFEQVKAGFRAAGGVAAGRLTLTVMGLWISCLAIFPEQTALRFARADEPRVAAADPADSEEPAEDVEKLLNEFRQIYHLEEGQVIRRIRPPFPRGRLYDLDKWIPEFHVLSDGVYKEANLRVLIYREHQGKLENKAPHFAYSTAPGPKGYEAGSIVSIISNVGYGDIEDPDRLLLGKSVVGDYVMDADAPMDKVLAAMGRILNRECGLPVDLELREVEQLVVAVSGEIKPPFVLKPETPLELYAATLQPGKGEQDQGTFQEFLEDVGRFIHPNRRVMGEVKNPPSGKISWHRNVRTRFDDQTLQADREPRSVLDHLEEQTGLTFALESRKFRSIIVKRSE